MLDWFSNASIRKKLTIVFGSLTFFLCIVAVAGVKSTKEINTEITDISQNYLPGINFLLQLDRDLYQSVLAQQTLLSTEKGSDQFEKLKKEHAENIDQVKERWEKFKSCMGPLVDKNLISSFEEKFKSWESETKAIVSQIEVSTPETQSEILTAIANSNSSFKETREVINVLTEAT